MKIHEHPKWSGLKLGPICGYRARGIWWFRVFGCGLHWKRIALHPLLFSERTGRTGFRVGGWFFKFLKPGWY